MPSVSAPAIAPGQTEAVEVEYKSPPSNQDDRRNVGVEFAEPGAPTFRLEVQARVRQPISVLPDALDLGIIGRPGSEAFFEIHNYTNKQVKLDPPTHTADWLDAQMIEVGPKPPGVLQVWRVVVRPKLATLKPGVHRGEILIAEAGGEFKKAVPIALELIAPIRPIPSRIFFGKLKRGERVERKITLLLSPDVAHVKPEDVTVEHDLGDRLQVQCTRRSPTRWEVVATLTPREADGPEIDGQVHFQFADRSIASITVPVFGTVAP